MSKRHWSRSAANLLVGTAIFLLALAWIASIISDRWIAVHEANAAYQKNAEYDRDKSADEIAETCNRASTVEFRECIRNNLETHYRDQATNEDLQAQQDMAFWAFWLLIASAVGIGVSAIGIWLLLRSLSLGRDANREAIRAANAATEANEILRAERRPWVVLDREIHCQFEDVGHTGKISWNYDLENKGLGLARDIKVDSQVIRRHHLQHMRAQLEKYLGQRLSHRTSSQKMAVLFPGERTDNRKYEPYGWNRYDDDEFTGSANFHKEGTYFMLMVCVTYRLSEKSDDFGFDVRMFGIEQLEGFIGPWGHTILEHADARLIG